MWTLYAGFAYILTGLILILIIGHHNWGRTEYSVITGGPLLYGISQWNLAYSFNADSLRLYIVRTSLTRYYDWTISRTDAYIKSLTKERDVTIDRLKESTKYNSTQQLLEKYGNSPKPKAPTPAAKGKGQDSQKPALNQGPRTGIAPPPTANIQHPPKQQPVVTSQRPTSAGSTGAPPPQTTLPRPDAPGAEFAPNAYSAAELTKQYTTASAATFTQAHWYDRILDALLGEDETQPKNRLALICSECRLVNGQAPPGVRSLEDLGRWRCGGCNAWNGKEKIEDEAVSKLVQNWEEERNARTQEMSETVSDSIVHNNVKEEQAEDSDAATGGDEGSGILVKDESVDESPAPARTTRSKTKAKAKQ